MTADTARHTEQHFEGSDGITLFRCVWEPQDDPTALVVLVHGVGEHCGRYGTVVGALTDAGIAVHAFDQRGHGRSDGVRVHIDRWTQYREDLRVFLGLVTDQHPGVPVVLYGHSMGSLVVLDYLVAYPDGLAGAVISGVALEPIGVAGPVQIAMARLLTDVFPKISVSLGIDASSLTHDEDAVAAFRADPLVTGRATVRWGTESLDTVAQLKHDLHRVDLPLLVLHGADDPLNCPSGAKALFAAAPNADKTLRLYPGTLHEPHNDLVHEQVADDIVRWVTRLSRGSDLEVAAANTLEADPHG
ncbi:MAG: alpha/beta hydrolase [Coriobacteriia bacterium]|nr:alpha/beta hydrolase [Coriobacteriia bacterium]